MPRILDFIYDYCCPWLAWREWKTPWALPAASEVSSVELVFSKFAPLLLGLFVFVFMFLVFSGIIIGLGLAFQHDPSLARIPDVEHTFLLLLQALMLANLLFFLLALFKAMTRTIATI